MSATKKGERERKQAETVVTAAEALELLKSAISYCQNAGMVVDFSSDEAEGLRLFLPGCQVLMDGHSAHFVLASAKS